MKHYRHTDAPLKVFGVPFFEKTGELRRFPEALLMQMESIRPLAENTPGARVGFRTDATVFTVRVVLKNLRPDMGMSAFAAQSAAVMIGDRKASRFAGLVSPANYETLDNVATFRKEACMEDVTVWFPRNSAVEEIVVSVPDDATVEVPTPYTYGPILYYGSSITEGGCCCNVFNAYNARISRHLDLDYYNFGTSGRARGELAMADYINTIPIKALVYDYDHNAPDAAHLKATHETFFKRIREKNPTLPILMLSMPKAAYSEANRERRAVIRATYDNAVAAGDKYVWFIDGETLVEGPDRDLCFVDITHPNDIGFERMAKVIEPVIKEMLEIE